MTGAHDRVLDLAAQSRAIDERWRSGRRGTVRATDLHAAFHAATWGLVDEIGLRDRDPDAVEGALVYLEADPWCHRSGYLKDRALVLLARHDLDADHRRRLVPVVLRVVDEQRRRSLTGARMLTRRHLEEDLRSPLRERLLARDDGVQGCALALLMSLRRPRLDDDETAAGRSYLLREVHTCPPELSAHHLARLVRLVWTPAWQTELLENLRRGADAYARDAVLELFRLGRPIVLTERERATVSRALVATMRSLAAGDREAVQIARRVAGPEIEEAVWELTDDPRPEVVGQAVLVLEDLEGRAGP